MNIFNLKSRKMHGYIVFLIEIGFIITGMNAIGPGQPGVQQEEVEEEQIIPLPDFIETIHINQQYEENPEFINRKMFNKFFTEEKLLLDKLVFLNNIHGASSSSNPKKTSKGKPFFNEKKYLHDVQEIASEKVIKYKHFPHFVLSDSDADDDECTEVMRLLFDTKKDVSKVETGLPTDEREAVALVYVTYLSFWLTVHFRICFLTFDVFNDLLTPKQQQLKAMCKSYFEELVFAFKEFRNILENALNVNCYLFRNTSNDLRKLTKGVLKLSLGSVFKKNEENCDSYFDGIICWSRLKAIKVNNKYYRTIFPHISEDDVHIWAKKELYFVFSDLYRTFGPNFNIVKVVIMTSKFSRIISNIDLNAEFLSRPLREAEYHESFQMWQLLMNNQLQIHPNIGTLQRLNNAIRIIRLVRNFHYTIIFMKLPN